MVRLFNINNLKLSDDRLNRWFDSFNDELKEHINKKGNPEKRKIAILEYAMLQRLLWRKKLPLIYFNENGKPYIDGRRYFNISNSGEYICIALSWREIGVDLQKIFEYDERLAERICSESELEEIKNSEDKDEALTRLWTIKESIIKCEGSSIAQDLKKINMDTNKYRFKCRRASEYYLTICEKLD